MMVLGIAVALVVVALARPARPPVAAEHVAPEQSLTQPAEAAAVAQPAAAPVSTPVKKAVAPKPRTNPLAESAKVARTEAAASTPAEPEPEPARSAAAPAPAPAETAGPSPVTITGCLEMSVDETEFRLTDTDGAEAPKARNWHTGFLKKRSAPITLVEAPDAHALVGKRVAATGLLTSRSMKVSALRIVTPSCS